MESRTYLIASALQESIEVKRALLERDVPLIARMADLLINAFQAGHKVVLFGNGGSAADAQHVAAELVNRFLMDRDALPAIALSTNTSVLTSVGNDAGFDQIFSRQVRALVQEGDVVVGISTSGNSPNVLNGILAATEKGAVTLGFTGRSGGKLKELVDVCLCVPSDHTPCVQEAHITVWHAICEVVEQELVRHEAIWQGVPEDRIFVAPGTVETTYQEAMAVGRLAAERGWRSLIVVTDPYHTRRCQQPGRYP